MIYYKFTQLKPIYYFCEIDYKFKTERWLPVVGYEGIYEVSDLGRFKSLNYNQTRVEKMLKQNFSTSGYLNVGLCKSGKSKTDTVHKLIAIAFLNHIPDGHELIVDHIDNNKLNNNLINLQLISSRVNNSKDTFRKKITSKFTGVCWNKRDKNWKSAIRIDGKTTNLGYFANEYDAHLTYQNKLKEIII